MNTKTQASRRTQSTASVVKGKRSKASAVASSAVPADLQDLLLAVIHGRKKKNKGASPPKEKRTGMSESAQVQDFYGQVVFVLPPSLQEALGTTALQECVEELEGLQAKAIWRHGTAVNYIHLKCRALVYTAATQAS